MKWVSAFLVYAKVMRKQTQSQGSAFLSGFLDGFGCMGQFGSVPSRPFKSVVMRLPSGAQLSPLAMVRKEAARLTAASRAHTSR